MSDREAFEKWANPQQFNISDEVFAGVVWKACAAIKDARIEVLEANLRVEESYSADRDTLAAENAELRALIDRFEPSEPIGSTYVWIGPTPEEIDKAMKERA